MQTVERQVKIKFDADGNPVSRTITDLQSKFDEFGNVVGKAGKQVSDSGGIFGKFGDDVAKGMAMGFGIGTISMVQDATQAVVNFAKESVTVGAEFEQSMANVQAITGSTGQEFEKLSGFARELGKTTMMSAQESADAMAFLGMAGWDATEMMAGLPNILNLTIASGRDFATVADIVSDNLTAFGMEASDTGRYTDALAYAMSNANVNMDTLGESLKYIAPVASSAGFSMEETVSAVMALGDAGIKGSQAGTTLRTVMLNLTGANEKATEKLKELGVEIFDSSGKTRSFNAIIKDLEGALEGMTDAQKTATLNTIVGKTAISGFSTLVNQGSEVLDNYTKGIRNSAGATEDMAETMGDTLQGKVKLFQSAVQELQLQIADGLNPIMKGLVDMATNVVNSFTGATEPMGAFGASLDEISSKTQGTLQPFDDMRTKMQDMMTATKLMGETSSATYNEMGNIVEQWRNKSIETLNSKHAEERDMMMTFFSESLGLEGKALNDRMKQYDNYYQLEQDTVDNAMNKILEIKKKAKDEKRSLTQQECDEIIQIMNNESKRMIDIASNSANEQKALMEALAKDKANINAENSAEIIAQAKQHKTEMVNNARTSMEEQIKQAYRAKEMRTITEEEYDKIVKSAQEDFNEVKRTASQAFNDTKDTVISTMEQAGYRVDTETGKILGHWDNTKKNMSTDIKGTVRVEDKATGILGTIKNMWNNLFGKSSTKTATVKAVSKGFGKSRAIATPTTASMSTRGLADTPSMLAESYPTSNTINYNGDLVFNNKSDIDYFLKQTARAIDRRY